VEDLRQGGSDERPRTREERLRELGSDPRSGRYRQLEAECAERLERQVGSLERDPSGDFDWFDTMGRSYDAVGPVPPQHFNAPAFCRQIDAHLRKDGLDRVVIDLTGLGPGQRTAVISHLNGLPAERRAHIIILDE
jgi:hypothetical protein